MCGVENEKKDNEWARQGLVRVFGVRVKAADSCALPLAQPPNEPTRKAGYAVGMTSAARMVGVTSFATGSPSRRGTGSQLALEDLVLVTARKPDQVCIECQ